MPCGDVEITENYRAPLPESAGRPANPNTTRFSTHSLRRAPGRFVKPDTLLQQIKKKVVSGKTSFLVKFFAYAAGSANFFSLHGAVIWRMCAFFRKAFRPAKPWEILERNVVVRLRNTSAASARGPTVTRSAPGVDPVSRITTNIAFSTRKKLYQRRISMRDPALLFGFAAEDREHSF